MSVLYVEWLQEFGKSNSETSLIQSVCSGLFLIGGELYTQMFLSFTDYKYIYYMTSDNVFFDWLTSLVTFFDKTLYSTRKKSREGEHNIPTLLQTP
jgi:hypothetical protein